MESPLSSFGIRFTGRISPQDVEAAELISVLSGLNAIVGKATRAYYGAEPASSFRIKSVKPSSIDIDGLLSVVGGLQPAFAHFPNLLLGVDGIADLVRKWLDLLKFFRGEPPKSVQKVSNGNAVQIQNAQGETTIVNENVYNTFIFNEVGSSASKLVPPLKKGATALELRADEVPLSTYSSEDASHFRHIKPTQGSLESEIDAVVVVKSPVLEGEGTWKVKYGRSTLTAKLEDSDFRRRVEEGQESFRHGDMLRVRLHTVQETSGRKSIVRHSIKRVIDRV